ncbi:uncharacterized protein [Spinacia oleracea]|uniref:DUF7086 domain-containing protein n=1 Tax=Spinacia oleracea TaxID=3562 RepID=A0ABM3R4Q7_SPIOL|nr:uncharacterized protein LOC130465767 [Spinacia oleracea]
MADNNPSNNQKRKNVEEDDGLNLCLSLSSFATRTETTQIPTTTIHSTVNNEIQATVHATAHSTAHATVNNETQATVNNETQATVHSTVNNQIQATVNDEVKGETIRPPFPWAKDRRAKVHSMNYLVANRINTISGEVKCNKCEQVSTLNFNLREKFQEVDNFMQTEEHDMHNRV